MRRWRTGTTAVAAAIALSAAPAWAADGALDTSFDGDGKVTGETPYLDGVARQSTGKVVGAGIANGSLQVTRHTAAGAPDSTWGGDGIVDVPLAGIERVVGVERQADDKIVVLAGGAIGTGHIVRLTSAGGLDTTYDGDGRRAVTLPANSYVRDGTLDSSGRAVLLAEGSSYSIVLARHTTAGAPDSAFDGDGVAQDPYAPGNQPFAVARAASGKLVVAGYHFHGMFGVSRYTAAGAPDTTFDTDGHRELPIAAPSSDVAVDGLGRTLVARYSGGTVHLTRLSTGGAPDTTFDGDGTAELAGWGSLGALAVQADGKPVVGGTDSAGQGFRLLRTTTAGAPDTTFAPGGAVVTPFGGTSARLNELMVAPDKKIVAAGVGGDGYAISRYLGGPVTDTTRPTATITAPTTTTGPVTFTFSEDVKAVSAANAVLRLTGTTGNLTGALACRNSANAVTSCSTGLVRKATLTPRTPLTAGQAYTAAANPSGVASPIKDAAGNVLVATVKAFRGDLSIEESDVTVKQAWPAVTMAGSMGGTVRREKTMGASVTLTFTGTQATVYPSFGPDHGKGKVYVDGAYLTEVDTYSATRQYGLPYNIGPLAEGTHTVRLEASGTKSASSSDTFVGLDAFKVGSAAPQTDPVGAYLWRSGALATASGGRFATTTVGNGSVTLTFRGTSVSWRSYTASNQGTAKVFVDGVQNGAVVDNYAASAAFVSRSITGLTDAVHTIRIVPTGARSASSTGTGIGVDRFNVG